MDGVLLDRAEGLRRRSCGPEHAALVRAGQERARARGSRIGQPLSPKSEAVRAALRDGVRPNAVCRHLGVGKSLVMRVRGELEAEMEVGRGPGR